MKQRIGVLLLAVIAAFLCSPVRGEAPKEGTVSATPIYTCTSGEVMAAGGTVGASYELMGTIAVGSNSSMGQSQSVRCIGSCRVVGSVFMNSGSCYSIDPNGNQTVITYEQKGTETTFKVVGGTGRNGGMEVAKETERKAMILAVSRGLP